MTSPRPRQRGYVLMLTLLLIPIAAVALARTTRAALTQSMMISRSADELQQRWAIITASHVAAHQLEKLFMEAEAQQLEPVRIIDRRIRLADQMLRIRLTDEQAKLNLNAVLRDREAIATRELVEQLSRAGDQQVQVQLRPLPLRQVEALQQAPEKDQPALTLRRLESMAQVFVRPQPEMLMGKDAYDPGLAGDLTLWSDEQVNFHRAPLPVLMTICIPTVSHQTVMRIVQLREEMPGIEVTRLLRQLDLTSDQREHLTTWLTDQSRCFGIWLQLEDPQRVFHHHAVVTVQDGLTTRIAGFTW